jgi:hypothetical protein
MKINKKPTAGGTMSDANSYVKNAKGYCERSGRADGSHPVITRGTYDWSLWMAYFQHIGHPHAKPHSYANSVGKLTVPAKTPDEFEPGWRASDAVVVEKTRSIAHQRADNGISDQEKAAAKQRANDIVDKLKREIASTVLANDMQDKKWRPPSKHEAQQWLAEHADGKGLGPVNISDRLVDSMVDSRSLYKDAAE